MFQGGREASEKNYGRFAFDPRALDFVLLTHAHIDHSGLLPRLVAAGFRGPVYTTRATVDLLRVMLLDAAHIQEKEAEWRERAQRRGKREERQAPRAALHRCRGGNLLQAAACGRLRRDHQPACRRALPLSRCGPHPRFGDHRSMGRGRGRLAQGGVLGRHRPAGTAGGARSGAGRGRRLRIDRIDLRQPAAQIAAGHHQGTDSCHQRYAEPQARQRNRAGICGRPHSGASVPARGPLPAGRASGLGQHLRRFTACNARHRNHAQASRAARSGSAQYAGGNAAPNGRPRVVFVEDVEESMALNQHPQRRADHFGERHVRCRPHQASSGA